MENYTIYKDIAERTGGDIYIGVVGPVRTGKSTFIKNFMETAVIPNIKDEYKKERAKDELPQSSNGRTIMTTEPKFIPNEAVEIVLGDNLKLKTRMVDCVGYLIRNALGHMEGDMPRMVNTPWFEDQIPFEEAAEIGTKKVIEEHSTIGILITTDGTVTDIPREEYIDAEEKVVEELRNQGKPFVIALNTNKPNSNESVILCKDLKKRYDAPVVPIDCANLKQTDIEQILEKILYEFPITEVDIDFPNWLDTLDDNHWLKNDLLTIVKKEFKDIRNLRQADSVIKTLQESELISELYVNEIKMESGKISIRIEVKKSLFYKALTEISGIEVKEEGDLFGIVAELAQSKKSYDKIALALQDVKRKGYGIVTPDMTDLSLEEPEIVKQGSKFGVKLRAHAPSLHIIKADIETEVSPLVGSEKQSEDLVNYLMKEFEEDPTQIWKSNIFGKSLHELVNEGLQNKLYKMPEDAQCKLQETLERIINEGSGGLICIIL
ncbi:MAG: stage IV sporulation protein A [Clostridia bacterium]|nr:stage IV sporulation protein A [Clostridia bacterium]